MGADDTDSIPSCSVDAGNKLPLGRLVPLRVATCPGATLCEGGTAKGWGRGVTCGGAGLCYPPPVPPPVLLPSLLSEYPVYRRLYSEIHETYYFVDDKTQKSLWEVPEFGIVVSKDENSDKEYYTDCETGIVAWTVDSLALKIEEQLSD